tara:strand:+ start:17094 stop:17990 length:897 start_codon:yes stop_codon:yes gene_type:complete
MKEKSKIGCIILLFSFSVYVDAQVEKSVLPASRWSIFWSPSKSNFVEIPIILNEFNNILALEGLNNNNLQSEIFPNLSPYRLSPRISHHLGAEFKFKNGLGDKDINLSYRTDFQHKKDGGSQLKYAKGNTVYIDSSFVPSLNSTVWRDSIYLDIYDSQISQESFLWNNSVLLRFAENKRWSFYTGIQLGLQFNFSRQVTILESNYAELDTYVNTVRETNRSINTSDIPEGPFSQRKYKLDNTIAYNVSVPVGVDLRIGDNRFWKHIHPYAEATIGLSAQKGGPTSLNFYQNFGLRYKF